MNGSARVGVAPNPSPSGRGAPLFPRPGASAGDGGESSGRALALLFSLLAVLAGAWLLSSESPVDVCRPVAWAAMLLAVGGWASALACSRRARDSRALALVLWGGAIALRLVFLVGEPGLSDDIQRYVWEGALVGAGVDPYPSAPEAPELRVYQERWRSTFEQVNHRDVPAAYPPLTQALHAAVVAAAGGADEPARARFLLRLVFTLCDLAVCLPLGRLLQRRGLPRAGLVAWAWNPWVALEFAGSGHFDALAILLLLTALVLLGSGATSPERPARAALGLGLLVAGAGIKLLPAALLPFALRRWTRPGYGVVLVLLAAALVLLPFVLLTGAWPRVAGLGEYAFRWASFSLLFRWIEPLFARHFAPDESWSDPRRLARALVFLLWLAPLVVAWVRRHDLERVAVLAIAGFLLLTPTLHPWYLTWMVPFLALRPSLAWGWLVAAAPLLYWPLERWRSGHVWEEPGWLWPALAGPFFLLLGRELVRDWRGRAR